MFLNQISIGKRLTLVLGVILALFLASSVVAVVKLRQLGAEIDTVVNDNVKTERAGSDWLRHTTSGVQRAAAIAKSSDASLIAYFAPATAASIRDTNELQKFIESKMVTPEEKQLFAKVGELRKHYLAAREEVSKHKQAGDADAANKVFTERFEPTSRSYLAGVQQLVDGQRAQLDAAGKRSEDLRAQTTLLLQICTAVSLLLGALLAWLLANSITRPLRHAETIAEAIADMDLTGAPQSIYANDETGRLLRALDLMRSALQRSLLQVRGVVDSISTASTQIAIGNHGADRQQPAGDRQFDGRADQHGAPKRGFCRAGQPAGDIGRSGGPARWRRGLPGGEHHGRDQRQQQEDLGHHRHHRWHCFPDQHPGPQCRCGSRACR